jgi:transposase
MSFRKLVTKIVARQCWNNGHSLREIAEKAGVSERTIGRWLRETNMGFMPKRGGYGSNA